MRDALDARARPRRDGLRSQRHRLGIEVAADLKSFQDDPAAVRYDEASKTYYADTHVVGRVIITNYEYSTLSTAELTALYNEANQLPANDVLIDIRAAHPGGECPIHGVLRLRSFLNVLTVLGRGIAEEPEFHVAPEPHP